MQLGKHLCPQLRDRLVLRLRLASLTLGPFYLIAALQNNTLMMLATVPTRFLAVYLFFVEGGAWNQVAFYEGLTGVLTGVTAGLSIWSSSW
jgi:hypothetical protein